MPIEGADNVQSMISNKDEDQLVYIEGSYDESVTAGYKLYQRRGDKTMSLNRALNACPLTDEHGNDVEESACQYTSVPGAITSKAEHYTADGQHVLFRYISRIDAESEQAVDHFLLDVEDAAMYSLPEYVDERSEWISGNASVFWPISTSAKAPPLRARSCASIDISLSAVV